MDKYIDFIKKRKLLFLGIGLIFIISILCIISSLLFRKTTFKIENEVIKENNTNYNVIINYPVFNNKKVNKKINNIIESEAKDFKEKVDNKSSSNELTINYNYTVKDNIYSVQIRTYSYTGINNDYYNKEEMIYITSDNKELMISDLVNDEIYKVIESKCYDYLVNNKEKYNLYEEDKLKDILSNVKDLVLLSFSENELFVIIPPYKVGNYEKDINIKIDYQELKDYVNSEYIKIEINNEVEDVYSSDNKIRDKKFFEGKKLLAITFDDGPNYKVTNGLLDELEKRNARVSFFLVGDRAEKQGELVKKMYDKGHSIGSHSYDHKRLTKLKDEQLDIEINTTNQILKDIIGEDIKYLRPPYGSYDKNLLNKINMSFILWNVDTEDWQSRDTQKVCDSIVSHAQDGNIILLHDLYQTSVDGALCAIDILEKEDFAFVSLDEMVEYKNIDIKTNTAYRYFK